MRKKNREYTVFLSFLDIISCGLGGAILLVVIFSSIKSDKELPIMSGKFIRMIFTVKGDKSARYSVKIERTNPPNIEVIELNRIFTKHARNYFKNNVFFYCQQDYQNKDSNFTFHVIISEITDGNFSIQLRYCDNDKLKIKPFGKLENIIINRRTFYSWKNAEYNERAELSYGNITEF